jgi:hypothetical protein
MLARSELMWAMQYYVLGATLIWLTCAGVVETQCDGAMITDCTQAGKFFLS